VPVARDEIFSSPAYLLILNPSGVPVKLMLIPDARITGGIMMIMI
jgi:hypothetical protein